ncbi:SCP2 sterol-binding domain-containing protein [Brachymonas sp. G13]|nr:SCP2 sterol-binding domain-containing protein [Brachymonas sp. J145]MEE1653370.1 SCP2 sterol-binding domain-containing protein [Brachymonas sp. J145]
MSSTHLIPDDFTLPAPVSGVLQRLPRWPGALLFVGALNLTLARQLPEDVAEALQGRTLRLAVRDAGVHCDFCWQGTRFAPLHRVQGTPDLIIRAHASDFIALARRSQDPDTLFFNRRLSMEGDTELGLMVKNTLDAMELPVFDPRQFQLSDLRRLPRPPHPRALLQRLRERLPPR